MKLHSLIKTTSKKSRRVGLGYGSTKGGHTTGRGQKGQKSRGDIPLSFVGSSWVWFKRLPFMRGKSIFNPLNKTREVTLTELNRFEQGAVVSKDSLTALGFAKKSRQSVAYKIINSGKLDKPLTIQVPATKMAIQQIIQAGGEYQGETA